jgi:hypothetical protein
MSLLHCASILSSRMAKVSFIQAKTLLSNAAYLIGDTILVAEFACLSSSVTVPMDITLLHHCLCHHHLAGIRKLMSCNLVTGLKYDSKAEPDPVKCKDGKMHAYPFHTSSTRASKPLLLVHGNAHGPVKVSTHWGYQYWVSFLDNASTSCSSAELQVRGLCCFEAIQTMGGESH